MQAADELPGIPEDNMSTQNANESTEPLVGRLGIGAHALMHSEDISYNAAKRRSRVVPASGADGVD